MSDQAKEEANALLKDLTAKKKELGHLKNEIAQATALIKEREEVWKQAGAPNIPQADLDKAEEKASRLRAVFNQANGERRRAAVKIGYLKLARFTRKTGAKHRIPWFLTALIGGSVFFALAIVLALPFSPNLGITLAVAGSGFWA